MSQIFEAISDPTRQRIMALLLAGERPVGDLVDALGVAQPSVSKHLARLKAAGLVDLRADAQRRVYRLTPEPLRGVGEWLAPYIDAPKTDETVVLSAFEARPAGWSVVLEAPTAASVDDLWAAITEPEQLGLWLGATAIDPRRRGRILARFMGSSLVMGGKIHTWAPPQQMAYRWRLGEAVESPVVNLLFDVLPGPQGARLVVTLDEIPPAIAAELAAAWHAHLERLPLALRGKAEPWAPARLQALRTQYEARVQEA